MACLEEVLQAHYRYYRHTTDARGRRDEVSDRTPSGEGFGQRPKNIEHLLHDVRETLQMDVAFISKFSEDQLVFRALEGDAEFFGWQEGKSFPIDESYCKRVLDGQIPQ